MYKNMNSVYDPLRWREVLWLDLEKLAESFIRPDQELILVKYFTARITKPPAKQQRQNDYLEALDTLPKYQKIEGEYQYNEKECQSCHNKLPDPREKQSDVNLATAILVDAIEDNFDTAYLLAVDSDYKAPLEYIKNKYPRKRVIAEFVETNFSNTISNLCYKTYKINQNRLLNCQLPNIVITRNGIPVRVQPVGINLCSLFDFHRIPLSEYWNRNRAFYAIR